jgi:hypothetical protein
MLIAFEDPSTFNVTAGVSVPVWFKLTTFKLLGVLAPRVILLTAVAAPAPTATLLVSPVIAILVVVVLTETPAEHAALATPEA